MDFIIDLDGTLLDTKRCMMKALKVSFERFEIEVPINLEDIVKDPSIMFQNEKISRFSDRKLSDFLECYRLSYIRCRRDEAQLFSGVMETLAYLKNKGSHLFCISSMSYKDTKEKLKDLKIDYYFLDVLGIDSLKAYKPSKDVVKHLVSKYQLDISHLWMVGDGISDIKMAKQAGIQSIAIVSGVSSRDDLCIENPDQMMSSFSDLKQLLAP